MQRKGDKGQPEVKKAKVWELARLRWERGFAWVKAWG
jgi:hypothetical protein